jgi:hypothetical protein
MTMDYKRETPSTDDLLHRLDSLRRRVEEGGRWSNFDLMSFCSDLAQHEDPEVRQIAAQLKEALR